MVLNYPGKHNLRKRKPIKGAKNDLNDGRQFTREQVIFMMAMDDEKRKLKRQLTYRDILKVAKRLGYGTSTS